MFAVRIPVSAVCADGGVAPPSGAVPQERRTDEGAHGGTETRKSVIKWVPRVTVGTSQP